MSYVFYLAYEFIRAIVQLATAALTATSATNTLTTSTDHELAVGDTVVFSNVNGLVTIAVSTRYFVVAVGSATTLQISATPGGSPIAVGTGSGLIFRGMREISIAWPNQGSTESQNTDYTWEGGGDRKTLSLLRELRLNFSSAAIPAGAHAEIFGKTAITGSLPGGMTNVKGYGGGNDKGGVSCGIRLEGYAIKNDNGVETTVDYARWFPSGQLTFTNPATQQTGQAAGTTGYSFSATRTATDLIGGAIAGASTGGEFFYEGEI